MIKKNLIEVAISDNPEVYKVSKILPLHHWLANKAVLEPGKKACMEFEENGYLYKGYMVYDADTGTLSVYGHCNFRCPNWAGHHLYMTCSVCGQKG